MNRSIKAIWRLQLLKVALLICVLAVPAFAIAQSAAQSSAILAELDNIAGEISGMLDQATAAGDTRRVNCLRGQLSNVDGAISLATAASTRMGDALDSGDGEAASAQFSVLQDAQQAGQSALEAANRCAATSAPGRTSRQTDFEWDEVIIEEGTDVDVGHDDAIYADEFESHRGRGQQATVIR